MNVVTLAFPCIGLLARSCAEGPEPIDTPDLHGIVPYAAEAGLPDRAFRRVPGPETLASVTSWFRGDRGAIACAVEQESEVTLHLFSRSGDVLSKRRMTAAWHVDRNRNGSSMHP